MFYVQNIAPVSLTKLVARNSNIFVGEITSLKMMNGISRNLTTLSVLTHWGRGTHICVGKLIITGSDNDLSAGRRQANILTNAGALLIGPLVTNFSVNQNWNIFIQENIFENIVCEMASILSRLPCVKQRRLNGILFSLIYVWTWSSLI